jgi:hypothetical protein
MVSVSFNNTEYTQMLIDDHLYELPFQVNTVIQLSDLLFFHCNPKEINAPSLYCFKERTDKILWSMKNVSSVFAEIPENKREEDFISKEHYLNYMSKFRNKKILSVYIGEFRKLLDANNGNIISAMEVR